MASTAHKSFQYTRLEQSNDPGEEKNALSHSVQKLPNLRLLWLAWFGSICLAIFSVIVLIHTSRLSPSDVDCAKRLSPYSPAMEAVEYEWRTYENDFEQPSIYRGSPNHGLERAWEDLWQYGITSIDLSKLASLNKSTDDKWRMVSSQDGDGVGAFLEVFHQIHCLNLIRQYTYRDEYDYTKHPSFQGPQYLLRTHVDHCIETIRLNLMCIGDVTPLLVKIDPSSPNGESPDFDTLHKCRKFDKLQEWMKGHVVSDKLEHSKSHP